ncbi:MAG: hypothetical protein ACREVC_07370 [Burkholderiales bacterium]
MPSASGGDESVKLGYKTIFPARSPKMKGNACHRGNCTIVALCALLLSAWITPGHAQGQIPQVPAFLPNMADVPMGQKLPIDGDWIINTIQKRIRIEGGRAYALDPWVHMFVLKIEPLMVVLKNIQRTGPGRYSGQDLPLMGPLTAALGPDGSLSVTVAGAMGTSRYSLVPVRLDDPQSFALERSGQYVAPPPNQAQPPQPVAQQPAPQQPNSAPAPAAPAPQTVAQPAPAPAAAQGTDLSKCKQLDVDAAGKIVCRN